MEREISKDTQSGKNGEAADTRVEHGTRERSKDTHIATLGGQQAEGRTCMTKPSSAYHWSSWPFRMMYVRVNTPKYDNSIWQYHHIH